MGETARDSSEVSDEDFAQEQPFDSAEEDVPLFPETRVRRKFKTAPREGEEKGAPLPETIVCSTSEKSAKRKSAESKHFHYRNLPMWTTPTGLILIGWRMRCLLSSRWTFCNMLRAMRAACHFVDPTDVYPRHCALHDLC